jgi:putative SOS response-associated peptidase YedK
MAPPLDGSLDIYAVSKLVSNVKNNSPEPLEPHPAS